MRDSAGGCSVEPMPMPFVKKTDLFGDIVQAIASWNFTFRDMIHTKVHCVHQKIASAKHAVTDHLASVQLGFTALDTSPWPEAGA